MPLRDHFHPPASKYASWEAVHAAWPTFIVISLANKLPPKYAAHPNVHRGRVAEIDVAAFEKDEAASHFGGNGNGGVATAVWAPPRPTLTVETDLPSQDVFEVLVYDRERFQRLVAAIEVVSPANKDRPDNRRAFAAKCAALLQNQVSVTIIDLVTTREPNLYGELLDLIGRSDPALETDPPTIYAVACRTTQATAEPDSAWQLETWLKPLRVGQPLPTLPLWLADNLSVPLELEASYEETCKVLRIA
jgi:hypothetical protein